MAEAPQTPNKQVSSTPTECPPAPHRKEKAYEREVPNNLPPRKLF